MKKIKIIFPDGSVGEVNESDLAGALSAGAKLFSGATQKKESVVFADGSTGEVNQNDLEGAIGAGATIVKKKEPTPLSLLSDVGGKASVSGTENTSQSASPLESTSEGVGMTERLLADVARESQSPIVDPDAIPPFVQTLDFRRGYIPQVSRNPNADVPSVQLAKSAVLSLVEKQAQVNTNFSETIGSPLGQPIAQDGIAQNMQQEQIRAVQAGDIDAITKVIQNEKLALKREKENLPAYISSNEAGMESLNLGGGYESLETKLANEQREAKIKELDRLQGVIVDDGLKVIANTIQKEYANSTDKSIATQKSLGEKYRKAATEMQAKNADGTIDNYESQNNQAKFLLKNKYDKSIGVGRISNTDDLQSKYQQELEFSNQATFLGIKAGTEHEDVQEYLKNEDVVKFISPQTTDKERVLLRDNPMVADFISSYSTLSKTMSDANKLPSLYPKIQQQLQAEKVFQAFGKYVADRRESVAGESLQNVADVFSGYQLDEESEFKAVAELTGMTAQEVRQVVKDNPASAYIPSHLRKIVNAASGVLNGIEQSFNRAVLPNAEADIVNREISSEVFKTPEAYRLKDNNITIRSVVDGMANGTGQFLGYASLAALGGEVLAIPKSVGLFSEAGLLARSSGVSVSNLSAEAANLVRAMDKVKTVAGTFGIGYASSYEPAYKEASRYTNNESDRKDYAEGDAFFNGISELLLPDMALARQLGKSGTGKVLAALKSGKPLTVAEALLVRFGEGAKVMGLETAEEMIPLAYDVLAKDKIFDYQTSSSELMKQVYETALVTAVSTVPLALGAGFKSPTSDFTKSALYNAGLNSGKFTTLISNKVLSGDLSQIEANKQIKTINIMAQVVKEVEQASIDEGFEDDTKKKIDLAAQFLRKRTNTAIAETIIEDTQKKKYEEDNKVADVEINKILGDNKIESTQEEIASQALNKISSTIGEGEDAITIGDDVALNRAAETFGKDKVKAAIAASLPLDLKANEDELAAIENPTQGDIDFYGQQAKEITAKHEAALKSLESSSNTPKAEQVSVDAPLVKKSDADIEKRMSDIEGDRDKANEFNELEKEMEKRERDTVFNVPLENVNDAVDALVQKEKDMPNGFGSFIEKRDARETKEVADRYLDAKRLSDAELRKDFKDALLGNPTTWYADGLKLRESMKEAASRGIDIEVLLKEGEKEFSKDGFDIETARGVIGNILKPIFEGSQKVNNQQPPSKQLSSEAVVSSNSVGGEVGKYSEPKRYNSEIEIGQKYYDNRYGDFYTIEKMTPVDGGDVDVTLKYDKGKTRTESGNFLLYHIDAKQHSLSKEQPIVAETPKQEKTNDFYIYDFDNNEFVKTENAKPVKLDTEGDFFAVKGDNGYYTIYEGTSGQGIGQSGKLLRDAIKNANESIERNSKAGFPLEMAISGGIKRNGQSPRAKAVEQSLKEQPPTSVGDVAQEVSVEAQIEELNTQQDEGIKELTRPDIDLTPMELDVIESITDSKKYAKQGRALERVNKNIDAIKELIGCLWT